MQRPRLTRESIRDEAARWEAIDQFLGATTCLKPLRRKVARLLDQLREIAGFGLVEELEDVDNELRSEMVDRVVCWAFEQGQRSGRSTARRR